MKIKINYFTSTGNSIWVVNIMKKKLESYNHEVIIYDSVTCSNECFEDCDMVGFVYPVWGSVMPNPQRAIIGNMKSGNGKKVFLIGNAGVFSGNTGIHYKNILDANGYDTIYASHVFLPVNSVFPGFTIFKQPGNEKKKKMVRVAEKNLNKMCIDINSNVRKFKGKGIIAAIGGNGQRNHYDTIVDKFKAEMYIEQSNCSGCGLCYKICPVGAISKSDTDGGYSIDTDKCIWCLKCYNLCPKSCALMGTESIDTKKYSRYKGLDDKYRPIQYRK